MTRFKNTLTRYCICEPGCRLEVTGYRSNCRIHPDHRAKYNKRRREEKQAAKLKAESEYFQHHLESNPDFYSHMKNCAYSSDRDGIVFSVRGYFYEQRKVGIKINNRLSRWYARQLIKDFPALGEVIEIRGKI